MTELSNTKRKRSQNDGQRKVTIDHCYLPTKSTQKQQKEEEEENTIIWS